MHPNDAGPNPAFSSPDTQARPLEDVTCCHDLPAPVIRPGSKPEFRRGDVLDGRFCIIEDIYSGGMATLYRAEDMDHGRQAVVVKIPFLKFESDPASYAQFRREEEIGLPV
jgi:hypothetical protein